MEREGKVIMLLLILAILMIVMVVKKTNKAREQHKEKYGKIGMMEDYKLSQNKGIKIMFIIFGTLVIFVFFNIFIVSDKEYVLEDVEYIKGEVEEILGEDTIKYRYSIKTEDGIKREVLEPSERKEVFKKESDGGKSYKERYVKKVNNKYILFSPYIDAGNEKEKIVIVGDIVTIGKE